jgi:hypothetical protein
MRIRNGAVNSFTPTANQCETWVRGCSSASARLPRRNAALGALPHWDDGAVTLQRLFARPFRR